MPALDLPFWNTPLSKLLLEFGASKESGLSVEDATKRLKKYGRNITNDISRKSLALQFLLRFRNPLIILLLVASALSALTGDVASFVIIMSMVALSITIDFVQEVRAGKTVDALRFSVTLKANVLRDGQEVSLLIGDIVPGDIILLSPGMLIPADGRLISAKDLYVNQSILTGESFPAEKTVKDPPSPLQNINEAVNAVFMGTSVISGTGVMLIVDTGKNTQVGAMSKSLAQTSPPTEFERGVERFGMLIMRITVVMVLFVLLINLAFHRPLLESFLFALALAVGLTPELLPMIMTITFSRGAMRMAEQKVIIKHLPSMHNLGAMNILCTDKTGTLTEANIHLVSAMDTKWLESSRVFELAYINSTFESGIKSPLDNAILEHAKPDISAWKKIDEVPFDFERRRVSVLAEREGQKFLIVKGAPEDILKCSTHYEADNHKIMSLDKNALEQFQNKFEEFGEQGQRVLGLAIRTEDASCTSVIVTDETELTFIGFLTFLDPPKFEAADAMRKLKADGIHVKIITGDNERVTAHLCTMLGLDTGEILTGDIMSLLSDDALLARVDRTMAFCRVTPQQKSRIISTLRHRGHIVGFLGDGINDAVAMHNSDVGISVDSATDVAKEAADIILLERDLSVIHKGVIEGRRAVSNTEKYILMGSSSNFGNMLSMSAGAFLLPFLPMLPVQILLNNLLYDISQTALPFDRVDKETLSKPTHWDMKRIKRFMWIFGPANSVFDLLTFYVLLKLFHASETLFHSGWFVESLVTQVLIIFAIRTRMPMWRSIANPIVVFMALSIAGIAVLLPYTTVGTWFGLSPLPPIFFGFLIVVLLAYFALVELIKKIFFKQ
ncbi:magnesium-translocating P-type ATPase [Rickettsiales bacterium]|nr:magnesium-translocating P-type ATPase [Rickettsiales bacterium]